MTVSPTPTGEGFGFSKSKLIIGSGLGISVAFGLLVIPYRIASQAWVTSCGSFAASSILVSWYCNSGIFLTANLQFSNIRSFGTSFPNGSFAGLRYSLIALHPGIRESSAGRIWDSP